MKNSRFGSGMKTRQRVCTSSFLLCQPQYFYRGEHNCLISSEPISLTNLSNQLSKSS